MANDMDTLNWMIDPIGLSAFFAEHWEKKPLVLARNDPGYYGDLLRLADVDNILTTRQFAFPAVRLVTAARETQLEEYTYPDRVIDTRRLLKHFAQGHTIILNQLEFERPRLWEFCRGLERELSTRIQANIYLTPRSAQGFKPHYDSHDVFILQMHGTKHWLLYDTPVELPMRGQAFRPEDHTPGAVTREIEMQPGDMLYIPRGVMHDARTTGHDSLHITIGVLATTWSELLLEAVGHAALTHPELRRSLPAGFARPGADRSEAVATMRAVMQRVAEGFDPASLLEQAADDLIGSRMALLEGQITQLVNLEAITSDSSMGARPKLIYRIRETDEHVVLSVYGTDLTLPRYTADALRVALESPRFRVGDLPGGLDEQGKVVLARRLVREGLIRQV